MKDTDLVLNHSNHSIPATVRLHRTIIVIFRRMDSKARTEKSIKPWWIDKNCWPIIREIENVLECIEKFEAESAVSDHWPVDGRTIKNHSRSRLSSNFPRCYQTFKLDILHKHTSSVVTRNCLPFSKIRAYFSSALLFDGNISEFLNELLS